MDNLMTADDLMERWRIEGNSPRVKERKLLRRMAEWGLRPMDGTRGKGRLFRPIDILRAEARAVGESA